MNRGQFKDPVSHLCLAGAVVAPWCLTQEVASANLFDEKYFSHWIHWIQYKNSEKKSIVPQYEFPFRVILCDCKSMLTEEYNFFASNQKHSCEYICHCTVRVLYHTLSFFSINNISKAWNQEVMAETKSSESHWHFSSVLINCEKCDHGLILLPTC